MNTETPAPTPTQEVPSETTANDPVIPSCEEIASVQEVQARVGEGFELLPGHDVEAELAPTLGEAAATALAQSAQQRSCAWVVMQSDGGTFVQISELPKEARTTFLAELQASDFAESEVNGFRTFVWETDRRLGPRFLWYGFAGDFVVTSLALEPDGDIGDMALMRLAEMNSEP